LEQGEEDLLLPDDVPLQPVLELLEELARLGEVGPLRVLEAREQVVQAIVVGSEGCLNTGCGLHHGSSPLLVGGWGASDRRYATRSRTSESVSPSAPSRWKAGMAVSARPLRMVRARKSSSALRWNTELPSAGASLLLPWQPAQVWVNSSR